MAVVVSIINLKGGVGKSTLAMILSEYLTFRFGKRVLLIDMDAQANLSYIMIPSSQMGVQERNHTTLYHFFESILFGQPKPLSAFVARPPMIVSNINRSGARETLDMVISTPEVAQLDQRLLDMWREGKSMPINLDYALKEGLEEVQQQYDVILIDCPPGLSFFSSTALIGSDFFVSPIIPEPLSLKGVELVHDRARELSRDTDCKVEFAGVILNIVKHYRNTHRNIAGEVYGARRDEFQPFLFWLPDNERLRALGEFEIDSERIKDGWAGGVDNKFYGVYPKYSVSFLLTNPREGLLSQTRNVEGERYRLHERIDKLVEEFGKKVGILA